MRGAVLYGPRDVSFRGSAARRLSSSRQMRSLERQADLRVPGPTCCLTGASVPVTQATPMGHEYCGIVEEVGKRPSTDDQARPVRHRFVLRLRQTPVPICKAGYQTFLPAQGVHRRRTGAAALRVPARRRQPWWQPRRFPRTTLIPSLLTLLRPSWAPDGSPPTRPTLSRV